MTFTNSSRDVVMFAKYKKASTTTDATLSMVGTKNGLISYLKKSISHPIVEVLCSKNGLRIFSNILRAMVKGVYFINARSFRRHQLSLLLDAIESQFTDGLTFNKTLCLSCGQVSHRIGLLLTEITLFFKKKTFILPNYLMLNGLPILYFYVILHNT